MAEQASGYGSEITAFTPPPPSLPPSMVPESVQKWLRREDWEALSKAWEEAEAEAISWVEGADLDGEIWEEEDGSGQLSLASAPAMLARPPAAATPTSSVSLPPLRKNRGRRPKWDEEFHLLGKDTRRPVPMRRYFDSLPAETTVPRYLRTEELKVRELRPDDPKPTRRSAARSVAPMKDREPWCDLLTTVSCDNDLLHPHLRHYFDRRGLEASYQNRPRLDKITRRLRPRTPQRPTTREKILKFRSISESTLSQADGTTSRVLDLEEEQEDLLDIQGRHQGGIHWGTRCLFYGPEREVKLQRASPSSPPARVPWVSDHHVSVSTDNEILNPMLRHYFDADGIESSFRNRGMHYGRPARDVLGLQLSNRRPGARTEAANAGAAQTGQSAASSTGGPGGTTDAEQQLVPPPDDSDTAEAAGAGVPLAANAAPGEARVSEAPPDRSEE